MENEFVKKTYDYDQYDRLSFESIQSKNSKISLSYDYKNGELIRIDPYISSVKYDAKNRVQEVLYKNGLSLKIDYDKISGGISSLVYENIHNDRKIDFTYEYDRLGFLRESKNPSKHYLGIELDRDYHYEKNTRQLYTYPMYDKKNIPKNRTDRGQLTKTPNASLSHCEEYLCEMEYKGDSYKFLYTASNGLLGGVINKELGDFNPNEKDSFYIISDTEALSEGELSKSIKIGDLPLGVVVGETFYPVITNHKQEIMGV